MGPISHLSIFIPSARERGKTLAIRIQAKAFRLIDLLGEYGVLLKELYTKQVKGKLRALRLKDQEGNIRVFYFTFTGR